MNKIVTRAIILNDKGKALLGKRARSDSSGKWALIGGKPDGEETPKDAIAREVQEELGLIFKPSLWMEEIDTISVPGETWKVYYFSGIAEGELNLKEDEVAEIAFAGLNDLENLDIAFNHKEILAKFFRDNVHP